MLNNFKIWLKIQLKKRRLMPLAIIIWKIIAIKATLNTCISFFRALKLYIYNNILTHVPIHCLRVFYLKKILKIKIGKSSFIHMSCRFEGKINIGDNSVVGRKCILLGNITIKNNVSITAETYIFTSTHIADSNTFDASYGSVVIEDYAWIGARAMIMPNVVIGRGAILGAASTATKNIPEYAIYAGSPAKEIGLRSKLINYTLNYHPFFQ
jgi:acetyltransferase-like isoleucine patch superfamily enzyme